MTRIAFHPGCLFYGVRKLACAIEYCFIVLYFVFSGSGKQEILEGQK